MAYFRPKLPSVKSLDEAFPGRGLAIRRALADDVATWGWRPRPRRAMAAADDAAGDLTCGAETIYDSEGCAVFTYLNVGETYQTTLVYAHRTGSFRVQSYGDAVERFEAHYHESLP